MASKPLTIPNVFASEGTGTPNNIPLLDADFNQVANYFNDGSFFSTRGVDTGAANAYVVTLPSGYVPSAYNVGMRLVFNPGNSNTGASTINVNALGTQTILTANGSALAGSEITAGYDCDLVYDGTNFRVMSLAIPQITSVRLRSFNAVGNSTFECNQPYGTYTTLTNPAANTKLLDRWYVSKSPALTAAVNAGQAGPANTNLPGTNFCLTNANLRLTLTTPQATLAAGDWFLIQQIIEGSVLRELVNDVHSISLLAYSSVAGLSFGVILHDAANTRSLAKLCTIPNSNTWTLITLPNLPLWSSGTTWSTNAGNVGYLLYISLACGTTGMSPANDTWQSANSLGAVGMSNWLASPANTTLYFAMIQHEPGPLCTMLQDKPFSVNLTECLRYYQKSNAYPNKFPTNGDFTRVGQVGGGANTTTARSGVQFGIGMAKAPTVTLADHLGNLNNVLADGSGSVGVSAISATTAGIVGWTLALAEAASSPLIGQWQADTGW